MAAHTQKVESGGHAKVDDGGYAKVEGGARREKNVGGARAKGAQSGVRWVYGGSRCRIGGYHCHLFNFFHRHCTHIHCVFNAVCSAVSPKRGVFVACQISTALKTSSPVDE